MSISNPQNAPGPDESPPRLRITSSEGVRIAVYDAAGARLIGGERAIEAAVPPGLYRVQLERNGRVTTRLVDHEGETALHDPGPELETPTPLRGAATSRDYYSDCAERLCSSDSSLALGPPPHRSRLFVFIRRRDRDAGPKVLPSDLVSIHDGNGRRLSTLCERTSRIDDQLGYLAFSAPVAAGTYRLRVTSHHRDVAISIPDGRVAHVFIVDDGTVRLDDLRVSLLPFAEPFDASSPTAAAMESVLGRLRTTEHDVPAQARALWRDGSQHDLCFGIALAHLLWRCEDRATFEAVIGQLAPHAAVVPDVAILDHVRRLASGTASEPLVLATPPLLRASLLLAIRHAVQAEPYSAFEQASGGAYHDSSWCTWSARPWDARWVASTIASLRATGRNTSIASIARTVALPPRTVERTLATLDATLALSGGVPIPIDDLAVPGYSLRELLGHGAQGSVYRATRERDGTEVALKIVPLRPDTEREPEVMARFHSIRILQVHARGVIASAGAAWFETELCTGSIDDALAETGEPLAVERACRYALQALEGLEYLHDRDFVHRDIKPANLLRRKNDSIVIADLGLTGQFEDHSDVIDGRAGGTARFAPREQLLDAHAASPASDVWSLAATLYFMLTLELPRDEFGGQSELVAARDNPIVSIAERRDDLPGPLVGVIDRALSIDIAQRPRNGREFRRALQAVVEPTEVRRRRALVIGVGGSDGEGGGDAGGTGDGLDSASYNDARRVAQVLRARGFEVDLRLAGQATRAEILDGLDHLIAASSAEDAAVIYYAGFGFLVMSAAAREVVVSGIKTAGSWQAGAAWHGITDRELSLKLTQLTARTRNATLILDCCLAPQMSRDAAIRDLRVRALRPRSLEPALAQHLADLRAQYGDAVEETACGGNPNVVVIAACGPNESAYYQRAGDGSFHGVFTMALLEVLETRADATTSWRALIPPISARCPTQRPRITGPAHRTPFSLVEVDDASRAGVAGNGATSPIAIAGAGWPVALDLPADVRPLLVHQIAEHPGLRVAEPGELGVLATLRLRDGALSLEDAWGPLYPAARVPDDVDTVLDQVATLGIAQSLRDLEQGVFADELDIELGIVAHGEELPLPGHGAALGLGDRVYLKIANRSHRRLFAHVFNIGLQGTIALLTRAAPSGVELAPGGPPFVLGQLPGGRLEGLHLSWPDGLPRTNFPRLDEIIVIITRTALDLTVFEIRPSIARRPGDPRLHDLLSSLHDGRDRARANDELGDHSFYLKRLSFLLHPQDAALGRVRFQVDENPSSQAAASDPDAWISRGIDRVAQRPAAPSDAPGAIAIRLADLIIEDAGALESSEIRLDALICTRAEEPQLGFVTCTDRWSRIANGARLYDRLLYRAAVRDFVDLVLFVSRDSRGSASLAQLFAQRSTSVAFQDAVSALRITRDEIAVPWVTAVGASAVLTHMAFELLTGVAGKTLGLYRTSFGQRDRFSVGRHPSDGMYRARGFSFSLIIEPAAIDPARR